MIKWLLFSCVIQLGLAEQERMVSIAQMRSYEDTTRRFSLEDILSGDSILFSLQKGYSPTTFNSNIAYWIELDFCIPDNDFDYLIEFPDQTIDSIDVYLRHEHDSIYSHAQFGDQYVFSKRLLDHKNFHVKLRKPGSYKGYARIASREYADIRVSYRTFERFVEYSLTEYYFYGIFYGMIIIISLYNVFIFFAIGEKKYLYYTFYILSVGMFAMSVDGIAYQKLWPGGPSWNFIAHGVALFSLIFWSIVFSKHFLRLQVMAPRVNAIINVILYLRIGLFIYSLVFDNSFFQYRNIEVIPLSLIFFGSIYTYLKGYKPARFFIVAYGFLFFGFFVKALMMYGIIPTTYTDHPIIQIISYYSLHLAFVFEMLFLSLALSDRIRILKENRDKAFRRIVQQQEDHIRYKDQINASLEQKIKDRTEELRDKNQELELSNKALSDQKHAISQINTMLDLENYKLKNNIQSLQKDRLLNKLLKYEEFIEVFDSNEKCLDLLATHKWKNGYTCKKCSNIKHIDYEEKRAKRCSKCGYVETATAGTLFHAIKFPLNQALYLLYIYLNDPDEDLTGYSKRLSIRTTTLRAFENKISSYLNDLSFHEVNVFSDVELTPVQY